MALNNILAILEIELKNNQNNQKGDFKPEAGRINIRSAWLDVRIDLGLDLVVIIIIIKTCGILGES